MLVRIKEVLSRTVDVNAETELDALDIVKQDYDNGEIVLDADDFVDVEFYVEEDEE